MAFKLKKQLIQYEKDSKTSFWEIFTATTSRYRHILTGWNMWDTNIFCPFKQRIAHYISLLIIMSFIFATIKKLL